MGLGSIQQKVEKGLGSECRHVMREHKGKTTVDHMDIRHRGSKAGV